MTVSDVVAYVLLGFGVLVTLISCVGVLVMPNVFAKLGADVLAVNPYASTSGVLQYDPASHAANLSGLVLDLRDNPGGLLNQAIEVR